MWTGLLGSLLMVVVGASTTFAQSVAPPPGRTEMANTVPPDVVRALAPTGKLRAAINFGNTVLAQRDPASGQLQGVSVELSRELGRRLGILVEIVAFEAAAKVF